MLLGKTTALAVVDKEQPIRYENNEPIIQADNSLDELDELFVAFAHKEEQVTPQGYKKQLQPREVAEKPLLPMEAMVSEGETRDYRVGRTLKSLDDHLEAIQHESTGQVYDYYYYYYYH